MTDAGSARAEALADALAAVGIDRIVASPFRRAVDSIAPLALRLRLDVVMDARLVERVLSTDALPDWRDRLRASFDQPDLRYTGGESSRAAMMRGIAAVEDALRGNARAPAIVTHGNLLTLILHAFDASYGFDSWQAMTNPDVYRITPPQRGGTIDRILPE